MPLFRFKVSDASGTVSQMLIEGDSREDAARRLQRRGLMPLEFLGEGAEGRAGRRGAGRRFDVFDFTDRLVPLLEAGIPLERALGIVGEGLESAYAQQVVADMRRGLHEGRRFSQLVHDRRHLFPPLFSSVVAAGEEAGALPAVLAQLQRFMAESRELRAFIVSASIYPLVVILVSIGLVSVLLGVVVPRFARVLATAGKQLPGTTRFLIHLSMALRQYWWIFPILALGMIYLYRESRRDDGPIRELRDRFFLQVPLIRRIVILADMGRMCRTMATLMRSGAHLLDTVNIAAGVVQNRRLYRSITGLAGRLRSGERLSNALAQSPYVPKFVLRMVAVGEETGAVEEMLERVADRYDAELRRLVRRLLSIFEPAVIVVLGLVVGLIVASMFLAIMDFQSGF